MAGYNITGALCAAVILAVANCASVSIFEPRILGGEETSIHLHPYQVSLQQYGAHQCGGSILSPKHVITAAHCLQSSGLRRYFQVRVGSSSRSTGGTLHVFQTFLRHPSFTGSRFDFDIGFVKVEEPIVYGPNAQPIALVPINEEPQPGDIVTASGWGHQSPTEGSPILRAVSIPIVDRDECQDVIQRNGTLKITDNMICAGSPGKTVYEGDSGGPLVNNKKQLVGIASFTNIKRASEVPAVYTNVASPGIHNFITEYVNRTQ